MLLDRNGPLNDILSRLTGQDIQVLWLSNPDIALLTVTLLDIWNWTPFSFIIMLAGLVVVAERAGRGGADPRRLVLAHLSGRCSCRCCAR